MSHFIRGIFVAVALTCSFAANTFAINSLETTSVLSDSDVKHLQIQKQSLIEVRDQAIAESIQVAYALEVFTKAMAGQNPSAFKDRTLPVIEGFAAAGSTKLMGKFSFLNPLVEWLMKIAPSVVKVSKGVPYLATAGAVGLAYKEFRDFNQYSDAVQHLNSIKAEDADTLIALRNAEFTRLLERRNSLIDTIAKYSNRIDDLETQLYVYEAYNKFETTRYKTPNK